MKKILANDGLEKSGIDILTAHGFEVLTTHVPQEELVSFIQTNQIPALLVRSATKVRKELIDVCPSLQLIGRGGVGMDNIDVEYARSKGILVINTPEASTQSVAELVFAHLFSLARNLHLANREMPKKGHEAFNDLKKQYAKGFELAGKTMGIIGFGRIGQATARLALGLGMKVLPYDPVVQKTELSIDFLHTGDDFIIQFDTVALEEVITQSDIITLHVPMPANKQPIIGVSELDRMKKGVILINTARGGIIDEDALLNVLNSGHVAAAGLDVFMNEPKPRTDLLQHPRLSITPHIGGSTVEGQSRIGKELAEKIISFFS